MWKINSICSILQIVAGLTSLYVVLVCQICESKPVGTELPTTTKGDGISTRNFKYFNGTMIQSYKSGLYLASFLHQMVFDRELQPLSKGFQNDTELMLGKNLPLIPAAATFRRCGNETGTYLKSLEAVAKGFEGLLCSLSKAATAEQKEAFKELTNELGSTFVYKFMWCPSLEIRDCLVIKEAKKVSKFIFEKFELGKETQGVDGLEDKDEENQEDDNNKMDNNL